MRGTRQIGAVAVFLAFAPELFAHEEPELTRAVAERTWSFEPLVVAPLLLSAGLFAFGAWRRRGKPGFSWGQFWLFVAGWLTLAVCLVTPVHALGSLLFWVHMTQHELLVIVAAPLMVLSRPILWFLWALPQRWRERAGSWAKQRVVAAAWAAVTVPVFVWVLHGGTLWAWHIPYLYDASVQYEWVHALQHTTFLGTALLFWWTLLHGRHGRLTYGMGVIYCFTTAVHTSLLGALMTFAQRIWYPIYAGRTAAFGLTPLEDQQIGGLIMWVPAGVIFLGLTLWLLAGWIEESGRRVKYSRVAELVADAGVHKALTIAIACGVVLMMSACDPATPNYLSQVKHATGGDPEQGRLKIRNYGCHSCHTIPGVTGADALVGPPLIHWSRRVYIAGELPNTPENLMKWIQHPPQVEPKTAMPDMGVTEQDSRDIAAYLYTIR